MAFARAEQGPNCVVGAMPDPEGWDTHLHVFDQGVPVQPGHYQPAHRPLEMIEQQALSLLGVNHLVLVQPSVYGQDHSVLLQALHQGQGRHRGVVVPGPWLEHQSERELDGLHALGIRGVRLNCVSPQGEGTDPAEIGARVRALMPRLRARRWHLQWYTTPGLLPQIARWHEGSGVIAVLDHLAGLTATQTPEDLSPRAGHEQHAQAAWNALTQLTAQHAWIKLSGWYRLQSRAPYGDLYPLIVAVSGLFQDRLLWGSDWPHTYFRPEAQPDLLSTWQPVVGALGEGAARRILTGAHRLYR